MNPVGAVIGVIALIGAIAGIAVAIRERPLAVDADSRTDINDPSALLPTSASVKPLTAGGMFWAVFGALWAFSATAGIIYGIMRLILT